MTVSELIEILKAQDPKAIVMIDGFDGYAYSKLESRQVESGDMRQLKDSRWEVYERLDYTYGDFEGDTFPTVSFK